MAKTRTTLSIDDDVLRAARVAAVRAGKRDSELVEDALREYLGFGVIQRIQARSTFTPDEVEALIESEVYAPRAEQRAARRP